MKLKNPTEVVIYDLACEGAGPDCGRKAVEMHREALEELKVSAWEPGRKLYREDVEPVIQQMLETSYSVGYQDALEGNDKDPSQVYQEGHPAGWVRKVLDCLVCGKVATVVVDPTNEFSGDYGYLAQKVAREQDWQMTENAHGVFLCCSDCIPKAYTEAGGKLGRLSPAWQAKMVPKR